MINFSEILEYADRANDVYGDDEGIKSKYSVVEIFELPQTNGKCFIQTCDAEKIQWIVVRGTSNGKNIKIDAEYLKVEDEKLGVPVHKGFYEMAVEAYALIVSKIKKDYALKLAGHSLGGAVVVILGMLFKEAGFLVGRIITFGQPKLTTLAGVEKYRNVLDLVRVADQNDPVPLVPPLTLITWLDLGAYRHFGSEILILEGPSYVEIEEERAEGININSFWEHLGLLEVSEHFMKTYLGSLRTLNLRAV